MKFYVRVIYHGDNWIRMVKTVTVCADTVSEAHTKAHGMIADAKEIISSYSRSVRVK